MPRSPHLLLSRRLASLVSLVSLAAFACGAFGSPAANAATAASASAEEVSVSRVNFTSVRPPLGSEGTWLETEITLAVKPAPRSPGQMVSRVRVSLLLGFESPAMAIGERRSEYYRAEAECIALEPGRAYVRFYLPPEIVKRDRLHGDPRFWSVELAVGEKALPPTRAAYASPLGSAEQRRNFLAQATSAAPANDGILQPQFLTPFRDTHPRATPSFVRRDSR